MIKKAYSIQMSYEVSNEEKEQAEKALLYFSHVEKALDLAENHLNMINTPFKDNPEMDPSAVMKIRASLRVYRDKSVENFNNFKHIAFKCVNVMQTFGSDTQTLKVMKSFISSIDELEVNVNKFVDLFDDLQSKEFPKKITESVEKIQSDCESIREIINERIINHIKTNILAKNWVDSVSNELQTKLEKKTPLLLDLFNKRQEDLNNAIKEKK